jgi:hypothetical protein
VDDENGGLKLFAGATMNNIKIDMAFKSNNNDVHVIEVAFTSKVM